MTPTLFRVGVDFRAVLIFSSEDHNLSTNPSRTPDFDGKLDNFVTLIWNLHCFPHKTMLEICGKFSLLPGMPLVNKISLKRTIDTLRFIDHIMSKTSLFFV